MQVPKGYEKTKNKVCKLRKSLYGLKQASRQQFAKLINELKNQNFRQSKNDYSLFPKKEEGSITILAVYVDDIILTGNNATKTSSIKAHLDSVFSIKDLGHLHYFLGIEVDYLHGGLVLSQNKFTKDLINEHYTDRMSRNSLTPLPIHLKLSTLEGNLLDNPTAYRSIVGKLNFLTNTKPDLSYVVQTLSQFM